MSEQAAPGNTGHERAQIPDIHDMSDVMSAREAAITLGVSERTIRRAILRGELAAIKEGRSFHITTTALDDYRASREQPRRRGRLHLVPATSPPVERTPPPTLISLPGGDLTGRRPLPAQLTTFVGRSDALRSLASLLRAEDVRLVTLTGPGGVGKTRLALEATREVSSEFTDGTVFVALATLRDPGMIPSTVVQALGLRETDATPPMARLMGALRDRHLLLILDNFEHLAGPVAKTCVTDLLLACAGLTALITSRTLLNLSGEHAFIVPSLALPQVGESRSRGVERKTARREINHPSPITHHPTTPPPQVANTGRGDAALDLIEQSEAVQLFVERARAAWTDFSLTAENAAAVTAICERVDGLPLAIELAAARSAVLSPVTLLRRLERRLPLLSGGPDDQPDRLRTMRDAIAWSYDLLDASTQALFRRLAVFVGGFTVEAAEYLSGQMASESAALTSVVDALAALLTGSLLQRGEQPDGESRFTLLETVREFALEQLQRSGDEASARAAHAAWCFHFMDQVKPELWVATDGQILHRIDLEHDNLRATLTWALVHDPELALQLASMLAPFWAKRCHWNEGRTWLKRALETGSGEGTVARAIVAGQAGMLAGEQGDVEEARCFLRQGLALADQLGDDRNAANSLRGLGILASNESDFVQAEGAFSEALVRFRLVGDETGIARCLNDLGLIAARQGDQDRAIALQEESLPIARNIGDEWQVCIVLGNLGEAYYDSGNYARGEVLSREALDLARRLGDPIGVAINLYNLGNCALQSGDTAAAIDHYRETLVSTRELGEQHLASRALDRLAVALHQLGASRPAARLFGAAAAIREALGDSLFAEEEAYLTAQTQEVRDELGEPVFQAAWASGRSLPFEVAITEAMSFADSALLLARATPAPAIAGLTRREQDVLRLVADGRSDKEIADALFVTRRSASKYVSVILSKLGVASRTAAAALVLRETSP
jgi:excisionase family DNA binding protein